MGSKEKRIDVKIVLLGSQSVGKTCLTDRYLHDRFSELGVTSTVGAAFGAKKLIIKNLNITLGIWDTAGAERYEAMSRVYYRQAKAAIVCFDLTDLQTLSKLRFWVDELINNEPQCDVYVAGTKLDLIVQGERERQVTNELLNEQLKVIKYKGYFETSAKNGTNVNLLFETIAKNFAEQYLQGQYTDADVISPPSLMINHPPSNKSKCCN